jgi:hypothetical protein
MRAKVGLSQQGARSFTAILSFAVGFRKEFASLLSLD